MSTLEQAIILAANVHGGQTDKGGAPYILHPLRVMLKMTTLKTRIVAVLHDVLEDAKLDVYRDSVRRHYPADIVAALEALTRQPGEDYMAFIARCARNPTALWVKIADLEDNMDLSRLYDPGPKDHARREKYATARLYLINRS